MKIIKVNKYKTLYQYAAEAAVNVLYNKIKTNPFWIVLDGENFISVVHEEFTIDDCLLYKVIVPNTKLKLWIAAKDCVVVKTTDQTLHHSI